MGPKRLPFLLIFLALFSSAPIFAYTIVLKDGTSLVAAKEYEKRGTDAFITLPSGIETTIPLSEIDIQATSEANKRNLGTAVVIGKDGTASRGDVKTSIPTRVQDLSDLIKRRRERGELPAQAPDAAEADRAAVRKTRAGHNNLMRFPRIPYASEEISGELTKLLRKNGLGLFEVQGGTTPERILVRATTNTEGAIFKALKGSAQSFMEIHGLYPEVEALELSMITQHRSRAGQFLLTPENASLLLHEEMQAADFFVQFVEF